MMPEDIYSVAYTAGMDAGNNAIPVPMIVGTPTTTFGNKIDYTKPVYHVSEGVCGFAEVIVRPARGKFVSWLKKNHIGRKHYYGGWSIWVSEFGQSLERKEAFARAFAKVLRDYGIEARMESRMD
jgi:hypothetical protein